MNLVISTRNLHKLDEIRAVLCHPGVTLIGLDAYPDAPEVVEDGDTFAANAIKKAVTLAALTGEWTLADDSGLEVDALRGAPGVHSARYGGEPVDYGRNNEKLLAALEGITDRKARFRCVIALSKPDGTVQTVEGRCEGRITTELRGSNGFGYDPLFEPEGYSLTFGELDSTVKNSISHRGAALRLACQTWAIGDQFGF